MKIVVYDLVFDPL